MRARTYNPDPLALIERGLAVFPLPPGGRVPTLKDWPNRSTINPDTIRRHWRDGSNIGVPCKPNGLLVLDLDRNHSDADGVETFTRLCESHGQPWPNTFTARSPRGGLHLYTWCPQGRSLGNTAGRLGPGIDTRGPGRGNNGGYVIGVGSIVNGKTYSVVRDVPVQVVPQWLADILDPPQEEIRPVGPLPTVNSRYVMAALEGEVQRILDTASGGRNDQLNRSAFALGQLVGTYLLSQIAAETALRAAADAIGLVSDDGARQVEATIASGLGAGIKHPRHLKGAN